MFLVELGLGVIEVESAPYDLSTFLSTFADIAANAAIEEVFFRSLLLSGRVVVLGMVRWGTNRWVPCSCRPSCSRCSATPSSA